MKNKIRLYEQYQHHSHFHFPADGNVGIFEEQG